MNQSRWKYDEARKVYGYESDDRVSDYEITAEQVDTTAKLVAMMEHLMLTKPWGTAPVVGALFECVAKQAWTQGHRIGGGVKT